MPVQSLWFDKRYWSAREAVRWAVANRFRTSYGVDKDSVHTIKIRQRPPAPSPVGYYSTTVIAAGGKPVRIISFGASSDRIRRPGTQAEDYAEWLKIHHRPKAATVAKQRSIIENRKNQYVTGWMQDLMNVKSASTAADLTLREAENKKYKKGIASQQSAYRFHELAAEEEARKLFNATLAGRNATLAGRNATLLNETLAGRNATLLNETLAGRNAAPRTDSMSSWADWIRSTGTNALQTIQNYDRQIQKSIEATLDHGPYAPPPSFA